MNETDFVTAFFSSVQTRFRITNYIIPKSRLPLKPSRSED